MFGIAPSELMLVALVAIIFVGPKDLPRVMRFVGQWVAKGRAISRQVRTVVDDMVRDAELHEMEAKWKGENERIMREHNGLIGGSTIPIKPISGPETSAEQPVGTLQVTDSHIDTSVGGPRADEP